MQATMRGAPEEARWVRAEPRRRLPDSLVQRMVQRAFPRCLSVKMEPLMGGLRNANFKLQLDSSAEPIILRVYEQDASLCQKEIDLAKLIGAPVPVAEIIHAEPQGWEDMPPFVLMRFVEGITFHQLKRSGDKSAIAEAARSIGETLAAIGRMTFSKPGWLGPGPSIVAPLLEGADPMPRFVDLCLTSPNLQQRMPRALRDRTRDSVWAWAPQLRQLDGDACLVHGDFGKRNILVRQFDRKWKVAAVLDWEYAVSGSPLADLGRFLRYERSLRPLAEPHFSAGYLGAAGRLPQDWRQLSRFVDLVAICESLTHDDLPESVVDELVALVCATVESRDAQLA
jgi:aminoglycoside phosphotransferase (APT) family kinase protein